VKDTESHFQTLKKCQYERFKQILSKIETFHRNVENIPNFSISIDCIMLNMLAFKQSISNMPTTVLNNINEIMIKFLQEESSSLYQELMNYIQIFSTETPELTQYIEQSNAYKKLRNEFPSLEKKVENLEAVASFFDNNVLAQIQANSNIYPNSGVDTYRSKSVVISESIAEVRKCLQLLPELFMKVKNDLDIGRENLATKVIETSKTLLQMIKSFEEAYIDNFHVRASVKKAKETLVNVQSKSKTFDDIQKKSDLFKSSLEFLKSEGDRRVIQLYPDLEQFECHVHIQKLFKMHESTIKTWEYISVWQDQMENISQSNIQIIDFILDMISKCILFNDHLVNNYPNLAQKFKPTITKMHFFQLELEFWQEIQQDYVKDRHWAEIFKLLKPDLINNREIIIKDIMELPVKLYSLDIRKILSQAKREHKYLQLLDRIKIDVNGLKLNVINYKEYYILSEFDLTYEKIEENLIAIELALDKVESIPYKDELIEWKNKFMLMQNTTDKLLETQKTWIGLEPTFKNSSLKSCLSEDFESFQEYQAIYFNLIKECKEAPNIYFMLYEQGKVYGEMLERVSNNFSILQKNIEEFIETKRLAFPRLFFLNDTQFIDFLTKLKNQEDFDFYISQLFPGASGFFFTKTIQDDEIPPQIINDLSALHEEEIDAPNVNYRSLKALESHLKSNFSKDIKNPGARVYDYDSNKIVLKEVLGIISMTKELFQFEKKIAITDKPESWLQKVELSMQNTVGKNINFAVASFPKKSLDEWILDHPQQIILTTIHLILTHEINELFDEMKKTRGVRRDDGEGESEEEEQSEYYEDEPTPKTPNTRDLIQHSLASSVLGDRRSSQNSYRSSLRILRGRKESKQESLGEGKRHVNLENRYTQSMVPGRSMTHNTPSGNDHRRGEYSKDADSEPTEEDKKMLINNMFGSDFDIESDLLDQSEGSGNDVMSILQEKSFKGLYLRLQFWINQICKSLHGKGNDKVLGLPVVHKIIMKSIVCFLNYMRDVVFDLKHLDVSHAEHYEWQKQIRLTWNGRENGCKVDCGAWTTYQGNEYLGSIHRIALSPLTTRYFVFISSAFREKSAVLFR